MSIFISHTLLLGWQHSLIFAIRLSLAIICFNQCVKQGKECLLICEHTEHFEILPPNEMVINSDRRVDSLRISYLVLLPSTQ